MSVRTSGVYTGKESKSISQQESAAALEIGKRYIYLLQTADSLLLDDIWSIITRCIELTHEYIEVKAKNTFDHGARICVLSLCYLYELAI